MNSPIWPPMSPAAGPTGRSGESGHSGRGGVHWDRRRALRPGRRPCAPEASSPLRVVGCHTMPVSWEGDRCYQQLTQEPCNLIGLLLLDGLIVEDFKENVQHQDVLPAEGVGEETSVQVAFLSPTSWVTSASYPHRISVSVSIKLDANMATCLPFRGVVRIKYDGVIEKSLHTLAIMRRSQLQP